MGASREELEGLIRAADAAGDGEAVRVLFGEMDKLGATPAAAQTHHGIPESAEKLTYSPDGRVLGVQRREGEGLIDYAKRQTSFAAKEPFGASLKRQAGEMVAGAAAPIRGAVDAVTALPNFAQDFGVGMRNLITGSNYEMPSRMYERAQDEVLPVPNVPGSSTMRFGTSLLASAGLPAATQLGAKALAPAGFQTAKQTAKVAEQAAARAAIAEGQKRGVPVFADDVLQSPMLKRASVAAEQVPIIGTSAGRAAQNVAAQGAVKTSVDKMSGQMSDDIPAAVQKSMGRRLGQFKDAAGKLYDKVATRLDPAGNVQTPTLSKVIQQKIADEQKLGSVGNKEVLALLEKYKTAPNGNFSMMRDIRSQLGSDISDFYTGANKTIGAKGVGSLQAIKNALEDDMRAFATAQGNDSAKLWKAADGFYRANIAKFKEAGFRDLVKTTEPEKVWRYIVAQGGLKSRSDKMFATLDNAGKQAVRAGLMKEAQEAATNPQGTFSPAKFAKYIEDHDNAVQAFFKGRDAQEIKGLTTLMRTVERAGQFAENPPTGQRVIPFMLAGGAATVEPTATATTAAGIFGFTKLLQTESGRNLLLLMSRTGPGSPGAQKLAGEAAKMVGKYGPVTGQATTRESE